MNNKYIRGRGACYKLSSLCHNSGLILFTCFFCDVALTKLCNPYAIQPNIFVGYYLQHLNLK